YDRARREAWLAARAGSTRWPVFVAADKGEICGFCSASAFDPRGAYETSVKVSVFVAPEHHAKGLAKRLYEALFAALPKDVVHRAYGLIVAPNPASVTLHERFGFVHVATLNEVGRKFGRYLDVMWFEKRL
ncbi:MAG: GNAT family N-acetyltransferase, partial [Marinicaulis sp.]|nr:GNAT family N-acetyltransferase [Marinicaulis sp.]